MSESDDTNVLATYCPDCFCNTGERVMPPHENKRGQQCTGVGTKGVYLSQIGRIKKRRAADAVRNREKSQRSASVRAWRGGLPGQGKRG